MTYLDLDYSNEDVHSTQVTMKRSHTIWWRAILNGHIEQKLRYGLIGVQGLQQYLSY